MSTARTAWDFRQNAGETVVAWSHRAFFYKNTQQIPVFHRN